MLARVFPKATKASPDDPMCFFGMPDFYAGDLGITEVHVSVTFTWDLERAHRLRDAWEKIAPAKIGGPALGVRGEEFVPMRYLARGYTITSRGCPRHCWFCRVPTVEGTLRLLPIVDGWKVQDDNLLACPESHFRAVVEMLKRQPYAPEFTGGLEALCLKDWHVDALATLGRKPTCFFAYDPGDRYETLADAARIMLAANVCGKGHRLRCYVLVGWPAGVGLGKFREADTFEAAETRLIEMRDLGYTPMAMLWRYPNTGKPVSGEWGRFQRRWVRPAIIHANVST
jgi:hypothetical protein